MVKGGLDTSTDSLSKAYWEEYIFSKFIFLKYS